MDLLSTLNEAQREAVVTTEGPLLILAGAGTGKTMALTYRIVYLIQEKGVDPGQILAVTFTNKAAGEMKERIGNLLPLSSQGEGAGGRGPVTAGTFHSICAQILRREIHQLGFENSFVIYDQDDALAVVKRIMKDLQIVEKSFNPKAILHAISAAKNVLASPEEIQEKAMNPFQNKVGIVYGAYQKMLKNASALDFDDLLGKVIEVFEKFPQVLSKYQYRWRYVHVDEYQDTNFVQYRLVKMLTAQHRNLCVVGDPDQNIYSWRGADISNILEFTREYPEAKVVKLEQNYRSTPAILEASHGVISKNKKRLEKMLWTEKKEGPKIQMIDVDDEKEEAELVVRNVSRFLGQLRHHVVLYRTHAQSRVIEEACLRYGLPYKVIGRVKFYARKEIKDMVAYLRLIHNPLDDASFVRVINTPTRGIGAKTIESLQREASLRNASLFQVLRTLPPPAKEGGRGGGLRGFIQLMEDLKLFSQQFPVSTLIREILHRTKYDRMLLEEKEVGQTRVENVEELVSVAKKYDQLELGIGLATFLEEVALVSDTDQLNETHDYLTLMTVHSAKGLEFEQVHIVGLEEGVFPHSRSAFDPEQMEEERRLLYVAMTRAKKNLFLIWARRRLLFGETQYNPPSNFLKDIPLSAVDSEFLATRGEDVMVERLRQLHGDHEPAQTPLCPPLAGGKVRSGGGEDTVIFSDETPNAFEAGDMIEHRVFGRGVIRSLKGDVAEIAFEDPKFGSKKIALNVAPVRKWRE